MSALQKLQTKIEQWKESHEALKAQNSQLQNQLAGIANSQNDQNARIQELEAQLDECAKKDKTIISLKQELEEKDAEIEKIITQVEALLA